MPLILACVYSLLATVLLQSGAAVGGAPGLVEKAPLPDTCPQVRIMPAGQCGDEEECPYQISLPPLTIQLPKQFHMLEKTMKELQSLKETVRQLRSVCLECKEQADMGQHRGSPEKSGETRRDGGTLGRNNGSSGDTMQDMQLRMSRMAASLKNARGQINTMQGRLDELSRQSLGKMEAMVNSKVDNITSVISRLNNTCSTQCAAVAAPAHIIAPRDCSDYQVMGQRKNGVYQITPDPRNGTFHVFCNMESYGGGWTLLQYRMNGSLNFNRNWTDYKKGFGNVHGEFWLGNDRIHLLTKARDTVLRIELEDFDGVREYAKYDEFYVANEFLKYRLSVSGYSGTAGDALHFSKHFNHDQRFFTTPDKDNDMYPSGNCGKYYESGWWFDACMSANLNGKYYHKKYKGKRNGIFWSTWHNMSSEYYPTNYRQAFKMVKMMIRPKNYAP
ncbi:fibrinogen-like 2a [Brachyhypopomus gauderio]|uniref:fibrinogen-like 2a n=1 Tax=Brachyhypopomus gauderio TaxID=698409 RepID=UPI0040423FA3